MYLAHSDDFLGFLSNMRTHILLFSTISLAFLLQSCFSNEKKPVAIETQSAAQTTQQAASTPSQTASTPIAKKPLPNLAPAVLSPAPESRPKSNLETLDLTPFGLGLQLEVPKGSKATKLKENNAVRISSKDKRFQIDVFPSTMEIQEIAQRWQNGQEGAKFRQFLVQTSNGLLIEAERNEKAEYHVEYIWEKNGSLFRMKNVREHPYSQWEASQMFHTGRLMNTSQR